jgi:hypothetical protein
MASQRHERSANFPLGTPAQWIAEGHVTCNIQCSARRCARRMVDVRLDNLPQDLPWSMIARRLVCKECGTAGSVNIVPNWHDRNGAAVPFTRHRKTWEQILKLTADRPYADPEKAARRLLEHAQAFEPIQDGRIYIEKINGPFLYIDRGTPAEYSAGLKLAIARSWLEMHDSGTYVKFTAAGADLFA